MLVLTVPDRWFKGLLRRTTLIVLFSGAMLAGYAAGIALIVTRLAMAELVHDAPYRGATPGRAVVLLAAGMDDYQSWLFFRYPDYEYTDPGLAVVMGIYFLVAATIGVLLGRWAPVWFAPGGLHRAVPPTRGEIRRAWRAALGASRPWWWWPPAVGALGGLAGAVLGEVEAMLRIVLSIRADWASGGVGGAEPPRPLVGLVSGVELSFLTLWAALLPTATSVVLARRAMRRDKATFRRWCARCGYPLGTEHAQVAAPGSACPECGASATIVPAASFTEVKRGRVQRWAAAACLAGFVALLAFHLLAPRALQSLPGLPPSTAP